MEVDQRNKQKELEQKIEKGIQNIFKTYDRDSSGFLDKKELKKLVQEMFSNLGMRLEALKDQEYDQIFDKFDKNGDGVIQRAEVKDLIYAITNLKNPNKKIIEKPPEVAIKKSSENLSKKSNTSFLRDSQTSEVLQENKKTDSISGSIYNEQSSMPQIEQNKDMKHIIELKQTVTMRIKSIMQGKPQEEKRMSIEQSPEQKRNQNKQSIGSQNESKQNLVQSQNKNSIQQQKINTYSRGALQGQGTQNRVFDKLRQISSDCNQLKQDLDYNMFMHEKLKKHINYRSRLHNAQPIRNPEFQKQIGLTFDERQRIAHEKYMQRLSVEEQERERSNSKESAYRQSAPLTAASIERQRMNKSISQTKLHSIGSGIPVIQSSPIKMTVEQLLPGHKLILQATIDQIIKVLETIITFIQTESYDLYANHRELLKHRHQQKYLLLKLIEYLRQGSYHQFAIECQSVSLDYFPGLINLLTQRSIQKDIQNIKLIHSLLQKERDPTYINRLIYKLAILNTKYEEISNHLSRIDQNQVIAYQTPKIIVRQTQSPSRSGSNLKGGSRKAQRCQTAKKFLYLPLYNEGLQVPKRSNQFLYGLSFTNMSKSKGTTSRNIDNAPQSSIGSDLKYHIQSLTTSNKKRNIYGPSDSYQDPITQHIDDTVNREHTINLELTNDDQVIGQYLDTTTQKSQMQNHRKLRKAESACKTKVKQLLKNQPLIIPKVLKEFEKSLAASRHFFTQGISASQQTTASSKLKHQINASRNRKHARLQNRELSINFGSNVNEHTTTEDQRNIMIQSNDRNIL